MTANDTTDTITFTVNEGYTLTSVYLNGEAQELPTDVEGVYSMAKPANGALVITATPNRTASEYKWYESARMVNVMKVYDHHGDGGTTWSGSLDAFGEYIAATVGFSSTQKGAGLVKVSTLESGATTIDPEFVLNPSDKTWGNQTVRGGAICAANNVMLVFDGVCQKRILAIPLNAGSITGEDVGTKVRVVKTNLDGFIPDAGQFSSDGQFLYCNCYQGAKDDVTVNKIYKFKVVNGVWGAVDQDYQFEYVTSWDVGTQVRSTGIARLENKDLIFAITGSKLYVVDTTKASDAEGAVIDTGLACTRYDAVSVAGVGAGALHMYVHSNSDHKLRIYNMSANGCVDGAAIYEASVADIVPNVYWTGANGGSIYVTDDEKSLFLGCPITISGKEWDALAVVQYCPQYEVVFANGDEAITNKVWEGDTTTAPAEDPVKDGYIFKGWFNGDVAFDATVPVTADVTYTAKFEKAAFAIILADVTKGYASTLEGAIAAAADGDTIMLLDDYTPADTEKVIFMKSTTLDLNGKTLTFTDAQRNGKKLAMGVEEGDAPDYVTFTNGTMVFVADSCGRGLNVFGGTANIYCTITQTGAAGKAQQPIFDSYAGATINIYPGAVITAPHGDIFRSKGDEPGGVGDCYVNIYGGTLTGENYGFFCINKPYVNFVPNIKDGVINFSKTWFAYDQGHGYTTGITCSLDDTCKAKFDAEKDLTKYIAPGYALVKGDDDYYTIQQVFGITITEPANGTVTADKASTYAGDTVTLTVAPADGYKLKTIAAATADGAVTLTEATGGYTFEMPAAAVTVTAEFEKDAQPVNPEEPQQYDDAEKAKAAADAINAAKETMIVTPEGATPSAYTALFTAVVTADNKVVVELNEDGTNAVEAAANEIETAVASKLENITAAEVGDTVELGEVTNVEPGFFYGVAATADLTGMKTAKPDNWVQAKSTTVTGLSAKKPDASKGFFQIKVSVKAPVTETPAE